MVTVWSLYSLYIDHTVTIQRNIHYLFYFMLYCMGMVNVWSMVGKWPVYGLWTLCGLCMVCVWSMLGKCKCKLSSQFRGHFTQQIGVSYQYRVSKNILRKNKYPYLHATNLSTMKEKEKFKDHQCLIKVTIQLTKVTLQMVKVILSEVFYHMVYGLYIQ